MESFEDNECDGWGYTIKKKEQWDNTISIKEYLLAFCMWLLIYVIVS